MIAHDSVLFLLLQAYLKEFPQGRYYSNICSNNIGIDIVDNSHTMKAVIQRVTSASVSVNNEIVSSIGRGLCVLVGISRDDTQKDVEYIARKIVNLKLFSNGEARWKKSVKDENLEILCVSQFTLYSILKGNKLDFHCAMAPDQSKSFYEGFLSHLKSIYAADLVKDGAFGEYMQVQIQNDGPVTIELDSQPTKKNDE